MDMKPFPEIPNCELYLAGGAVRDSLLGLEPKDRDFVVITTLSFDELVNTIETLPEAKVFQARPEFMTIRCLINKEAIDIVFPRKEGGYEDFRHPEKVERVTTLKEDALRRDFTINAMYMDKNRNVIDYFEGKNDLKKHIIRCVGNPEDRFKEDALRILRAIRFAAKFNKGEISLGTSLAMIKYRDNLNTIPVERIKDELNKSFEADAYTTWYWINALKLYSLFKYKNLHFELSNKQ